MSYFTDKEIAYLKSQRLGRLATINEQGEPHVVPVGFRYNEATDAIEIGGHNFGKSKKFRDMQRNNRVAFVVDDVLPPWVPRGVEIRGFAQIVSTGGQGVAAGAGFADEMIRLQPARIVGWGLDTDAYRPHSRTVSQDGETPSDGAQKV